MKWVSIENSLPDMVNDGMGKYSDYVVVKSKNNKYPEVALLEEVDGVIEWYFPNNDESDGFNSVTHWCELPK
jgi:hypothetical protein